jgi:hypothetical protein
MSECAECGETFVPRRYDQRFCCAQHKTNYHKRSFYQREKSKLRDYAIASSELDDLKRENERLKNELDKLKTDGDAWRIIQNSGRTNENKIEFIKRLIDDGYLIVNEHGNEVTQDVEQMLITYDQQPPII